MNWHSISVVLKLASFLATGLDPLRLCVSVAVRYPQKKPRGRILFRRRVIRWDLWRLGLRVCLCSAAGLCFYTREITLAPWRAANSLSSVAHLGRRECSVGLELEFLFVALFQHLSFSWKLGSVV